MYQIITGRSETEFPKVTPDMILFCIKIKTIIFDKYISKDGNKTSDISNIKLFKTIDETREYISSNSIDGEIRHIDPVSMKIK